MDRFYGSDINQIADDLLELRHRVTAYEAKMFTYKFIWQSESIMPHRKIQIYSAVQLKTLEHGISGLIPTQAHEKRLEGVQVRGLRQILKIPAAYISRISNDQVLQRANTPSITETWRMQRLRTLGHLVRHPEQPHSWATLNGDQPRQLKPNVKNKQGKTRTVCSSPA